MRWEPVQRLSVAPARVLTGSEAAPQQGPAPRAAAQLAGTRPVVVYVSDGGAPCEQQERLETLTFASEKVALALKAFRTVRMDRAQVAADPLLAGQGDEVPRLLLVTPGESKVVVLEKSRLAASAVYKALEDASDRCHEQRLDKVVKAHLALLTDQDQLAGREKTLRDRQARLAGEEPAKVRRELAEVAAGLEALRQEQHDLRQRRAALWELTPKERD
ncbi:MAG: hypothetical protein ACKOSS_05040 [Planctomycetia bacterium]